MTDQKIKWFPAPIKTHWVSDVVQADLEIDNNHTLSIYCEADQTKKVAAMFKREWVGLTDTEVIAISKATSVYGSDNHYEVLEFVAAIEAKLKEKNT
jgi:transcriptional/translational regulatory protein YebC/TACO1